MIPVKEDVQGAVLAHAVTQKGVFKLTADSINDNLINSD